MTFNKAGLNLTNINLTNLNVTFYNSTNEIIQYSIAYVNNSLGWKFPAIILSTIMLLIFIYVSDVTSFGKLRYSGSRGFFIASCITTILGVVLIQVGWIYSLKIVGIFFGVTFLSAIQTITSDYR